MSLHSITVEVTPETLRVLKRARRLYEGLTLGEYKLYDQAAYKFLEPNRAITADTAAELQRLMKQLEPQVERIDSVRRRD